MGEVEGECSRVSAVGDDERLGGFIPNVDACVVSGKTQLDI
jgi:hypothetical protein